MSAGDGVDAATGACADCLRRSWLLSELSGPLEFFARDRGRLMALLALADDELLRAVAGRRASELAAQYERFDTSRARRVNDVETTCHHRRGYPHALNTPAAPRMLDVAGGAQRLARLTSAPVVAILGSKTASDYGMEIATSLARGLTASGVTVTACVTDGIAVAAHAGSIDASGESIAVIGDGLGACPRRRRSLCERIARAGCAVSELPWDCRGRRWGQLAAERIVVELSALAVFVEAEPTPGDLAPAQIARACGRPIAAIPGRVTSPLSQGTHALLMSGASLVRNPRDVLELLYRTGAPRREVRATLQQAADGERSGALEPRLKTTLERVGAGYDTPDKLVREGVDSAEVLLALSELELSGLLARGDGGRYVPRGATSVCEPGTG